MSTTPSKPNGTKKPTYQEIMDALAEERGRIEGEIVELQKKVDAKKEELKALPAVPKKREPKLDAAGNPIKRTRRTREQIEADNAAKAAAKNAPTASASQSA